MTLDLNPFFNREFSYLTFVSRVLNQAQTEKYPILERIKFLSYVSINLDEFFEIRMAGLIQQADSGTRSKSIDGKTPKQQISALLPLSQKIVQQQYECWANNLVPKLKDNNIHFKKVKNLTPKERNWLETYFEEQIYPVLTPLAIDPSHPFPQLTSKSLNIIVGLKKDAKCASTLMAIVPVPRILPRVIQIESSPETYVFLSDVIRIFTSRLFPGYKTIGAWDFRITRNSDLYFDEEESDNLLQKVEEELKRAKKGTAVRLEIRKSVDPEILQELLKLIDLNPRYVFKISGPINLRRLLSFYDIVDKGELKFETMNPQTPLCLKEEGSIFEKITKKDILLHHPYDSFFPFIDLIEEAAEDPTVFAIKQTLYRTSGDSPIIEALKKASINGKQVTALIEIKARFDEENNIEWARQLEESGVHVVYGLVGLKTHCKCCLIVRKEEDRLKRYAHLGTGNYNPKTAKSYTDLGLMTSNPEITEDVAHLFNTLTGLACEPNFKKLLVAPFDLHQTLHKLIKVEIQNAQDQKKAKIIIKVNNLSDKKIINLLYEASCAGVQIELIVRSVCCLIPGVPNLSKNITVKSILGRYLEHSRIFYFENAGKEPKVFIGSADWMPRNFYKRIEAMCPIEDKSIKEKIIDDILPAFINDNIDAEYLTPNGKYIKKKGAKSSVSAQSYFSNNS